MGMEILPLAKRSPGVKLHSFLRPLSWKSPFHMEETSGDALLEATGVPYTVRETGSTCQTSPVPLHGAGAKAKLENRVGTLRAMCSEGQERRITIEGRRPSPDRATQEQQLL